MKNKYNYPSIERVDIKNSTILYHFDSCRNLKNEFGIGYNDQTLKILCL